MKYKAIIAALAVSLPCAAWALGFNSGFGFTSGGGGLYTLLGVSLSGVQYVESASGSFAIGSVAVSTTGTTAGTIVLSLSGANAQGFRLSSTSLPANLICPSGGCPSGAGPYTDVTVVATDSSAIGSPVNTSPSLAGAATQITDVTGPSTYTESAAANSVIGAITTTVVGTAFSGTLSVTGANSGGFAVSGSNLTCSGSGCPSGAGPYTDFNLVATQAGAIGSPKTVTQSISGTGVSYSGPGDVASGAFDFWGLRAYNGTIAAAGTQKLASISNGTNTCDFLVATNGGVGGTASGCAAGTGVTLATFCSGSCNVHVLYSQIVGSTDNMILGNAPTLVLSCLGTLPCMQASGSASFIGNNLLNTTDPYTLYFVGERTGSTSSFADGMAVQGSSTVGWSNSANLATVYNGNSLTRTATDSVWHVLIGIANSTSSVIAVDGEESTGNAGNRTVSSGTVQIAYASPLTGQFTEAAIWPVASSLSSGQRTSVCQNAQAYWGTSNFTGHNC